MSEDVPEIPLAQCFDREVRDHSSISVAQGAAGTFYFFSDLALTRFEVG
ncbi:MULTISPECIES: hypothetical protein [Sphingomonadaceae]|nr:hypothetical protein [Sphingomonas sp. Ant H11]